MNCLLSTIGFSILCLSFSPAIADEPTKQTEPVTILLDQIWAYNMPGTREMSDFMRGFPLTYVSEEGPLLAEIRRTLRYLPPKKTQKAEAGFAVLGRGIDALREAHAVLVQKKKPRASFPAGCDVTAVFFSHSEARYVHIREIEHRDNVIDIRYDVVPHMTANMSQHFALIPLKKLREGKVTVNIIGLPMKQEFVDQGVAPVGPEWHRRGVCRKFSFSVVDKSSAFLDRNTSE